MEPSTGPNPLLVSLLWPVHSAASHKYIWYIPSMNRPVLKINKVRIHIACHFAIISYCGAYFLTSHNFLSKHKIIYKKTLIFIAFLPRNKIFENYDLKNDLWLGLFPIYSSALVIGALIICIWKMPKAMREKITSKYLKFQYVLVRNDDAKCKFDSSTSHFWKNL